ncbi:MAG: fluoride efflux transporter FluC [Bacteroidia bacterium]
MSIWTVLGIAGAGALGSLCRWLLAWQIPFQTDRFAWATFSANTLGCLLMGLVWSRIQPEGLRLAVTVGFLGGFTTFSGLGLEMLRYFQDGQLKLGLAYGIGSLITGISAVWLGQKFA